MMPDELSGWDKDDETTPSQKWWDNVSSGPYGIMMSGLLIGLAIPILVVCIIRPRVNLAITSGTRLYTGH